MKNRLRKYVDLRVAGHSYEGRVSILRIDLTGDAKCGNVSGFGCRFERSNEGSFVIDKNDLMQLVSDLLEAAK
jgi:hypothetical protein